MRSIPGQRVSASPPGFLPRFRADMRGRSSGVLEPIRLSVLGKSAFRTTRFIADGHKRTRAPSCFARAAFSSMPRLFRDRGRARRDPEFGTAQPSVAVRSRSLVIRPLAHFGAFRLRRPATSSRGSAPISASLVFADRRPLRATPRRFRRRSCRPGTGLWLGLVNCTSSAPAAFGPPLGRHPPWCTDSRTDSEPVHY